MEINGRHPLPGASGRLRTDLCLLPRDHDRPVRCLVQYDPEREQPGQVHGDRLPGVLRHAGFQQAIPGAVDRDDPAVRDPVPYKYPEPAEILYRQLLFHRAGVCGRYRIYRMGPRTDRSI